MIFRMPTERGTMSDLIRRDDVVKAMNEAAAVGDISRAIANDILNNIPSAEPERTAKAIEHDASVTDTDGYKYHRSEYLCGACKKKVLGGDDYCSHCGAKLDWSEL